MMARIGEYDDTSEIDKARNELAEALSNIPRCHNEHVAHLIEKLIDTKLAGLDRLFQRKPLRFD